MIKFLEKIVWITFLVALLVFPIQIIEPAPFDILVGIVIIILFFLFCFSKEKRLLLKKSINLVDTFITLFLFSNFITLAITGAILETPSLTFFLKTFYLILLYFLAKFLIILNPQRINKMIKFFLIGVLITVGFIWLNYILFNFGELKIEKMIYYSLPSLHLFLYPKTYFGIASRETGYLVWSTPYWPGVISQWGRALGWFKDPNVLGSVLAILTIYLLSLVIFVKKSQKSWITLFVLPYLGGMIFLVDSRGTAISLISVIIIYLIFLKIKTSSEIFKKTLIALLFLIILPITFLFNGWYKPRMFGGNPSLVQEIQKQTPIILPRQSERKEIIKKSLEIISQSTQNPEKLFLGHGSAKSPQLLNIKPYQILLTPHNTYLLILLENGLIGLFLFLFSIYFIFFLLLKEIIKTPFEWKNQLSIFILGSILLILFHGLVIDTLHWRHFWLILGMASALISINNQSKK